MDKTYITLFTEIAHMTELVAEQVLELNQKNKDEKGVATATTMRDDYAALYDKLRDKNFNAETLSRAEFAKFLVGAIIVSQNLEGQVKQMERAIKGYKVHTIPSLERVVNESNNDEEARKIAEEIFQFKED